MQPRLILVYLFLLLAIAGCAASDGGRDASPGERPSWQQMSLTDVRSGESFTLADFTGQVVVLETMAVWCPLCDTQQQMIFSALGELGEDVVAVSLDVDPGETADILARHADQLGLPWRFALAGSELSRELQAAFGPQILAPTATPIVIIGPDGAATLTPTGIKSWNDIIYYVNAARE